MAALPICQMGQRRLRVARQGCSVSDTEQRRSSRGHDMHAKTNWSYAANCTQAVKTLLASFPHQEMGFRRCEGILRLGRDPPLSRGDFASSGEALKPSFAVRCRSR